MKQPTLILCLLVIAAGAPANARTQAIRPLAEGVVCPPSRGDLEMRFKWLADGAGAIEAGPGLYFIDAAENEVHRIFGRYVGVLRFETTPLSRSAINVRVKVYQVRSRYELRDEAAAKPIIALKPEMEEFLAALQTEFPCT